MQAYDNSPLNIGYEQLPGGVLPPRYFRPGRENIPELRYWGAPINRLAAHACIAAHFEHAIHHTTKICPSGKRTKDWKLAGNLEAVLARLMVPDVKMPWVQRCVNGQSRKVYHLIETLNALYRVLEPNSAEPKRERRGGRKRTKEVKTHRMGEHGRLVRIPEVEKPKYPKYLREFA